MKVLNVRLSTFKLLEENIGRTLFDVNQVFFDSPPRITKIKINKWDLKLLCNKGNHK